ncbi:uncharacterized protein Z519_05619 [Cladophialophora bantiana CBS 173.52]|uniref:CMP/dCMP-type deaminase domain-containing protein n=1 Tax=Cladophialophora bantiana (strain ATCC 10958 / CBS 173.52 / CDC B-1940 / NIH 8579) TaxID=1442370 RepID=A0A0D2HLT9_CLAB1|nr:uncharacterized protein Z519_05619 [Cladophialophora bantiana CBS 173.52]KIW94303.1 hypothetical protein Z519_05619 [Cladophialophora bantiana CBS 173.52]
MSSVSEPSQSTHLHYLRHALSLARRSPPKPTNFRVGCVIVAFPTSPPTASDGPSTITSSGEGGEGGIEKIEGEVLSTGYTLEIEGNTHAEQNALTKLVQKHGISVSSSSSSSDLEQLGQAVLTPEKNVYLYTTLEPCGKRLSGNTPCVQRIISTRKGGGSRHPAGGGIRKVVFGAREPGTFVQDSQSLKMLDEAGVPWKYVRGMEEEILKVAKEGHVKGGAYSEDKEVQAKENSNAQETNVDDISPEERKRQEALPRNPKKRMMEVDVPR